MPLDSKRRIRKSRAFSAPKATRWQVLRTGLGWTHLSEADKHPLLLGSLKRGGDEVVLYETCERKVILARSRVTTDACFILSEYHKEDDTFELKRSSLVRPEARQVGRTHVCSSSSHLKALM